MVFIEKDVCENINDFLKIDLTSDVHGSVPNFIHIIIILSFRFVKIFLKFKYIQMLLELNYYLIYLLLFVRLISKT